MEIIDLNDTMTPTNIIKAIREKAHNRLIASRDTSHEALTDSKTIHAIILTGHAHQFVFALEIDVHIGITNTHVLTHLYATCHVLDVAVHNILM